MKKALITTAFCCFLSGMFTPALALVTENTDNSQVACSEVVEPITQELTEAQIQRGLGDALINVCMVGYDVAQTGDDQTNADNLNTFNRNIADPKADLVETEHLKDAYILGFNLGVPRA